MSIRRCVATVVMLGLVAPTPALGQRSMEKLGWGTIAILRGDGRGYVGPDPPPHPGYFLGDGDRPGQSPH